MYDREPRIEDFPIKEIPMPVKEKLSGDIPLRYYSPIGRFWKERNSVLYAIGGFVVSLFLTYLIFNVFRLPETTFVTLVFYLINFVVVPIGIPVSAIVSRTNARRRYENESYAKAVREYEQEIQEARSDQQKRFEAAHAVWMKKSGRAAVHPLSAEDEALIQKYENLSMTVEIANWIQNLWRNDLREIKREGNIEHIDILSRVTVKPEQIDLSLFTQFSILQPKDYCFEFNEHRMTQLKDSRQCMLVATAVSNYLNNHIDNQLMTELTDSKLTITSPENAFFFAQWTGQNPQYENPMRAFPE